MAESPSAIGSPTKKKDEPEKDDFDISVFQDNPFVNNQDLLSLIKTRNKDKAIEFSKLESAETSFQVFRELSKMTGGSH